MDIQLLPTIAGRFISTGFGKHQSRVIDTWELIYVLKNTLEMYCGDDNYHIPAGHYLLLKPGIRHGGRSNYQAGLSFFWIHFRPKNQQSEKALEGIPPCALVVDSGRLSEYFQLFLSVRQENPEDQRPLEIILKLIIHEVCKKIARKHHPLPETIPDLARKADQVIKLRFAEILTSAQIAQELRVTSSYLGRLYRRHFGCSITSAINLARIYKSATFLRETHLSIKEISQRVGFNDQAYFRRCFFHVFANTPKRYRQLHQPGHTNIE